MDLDDLDRDQDQLKSHEQMMRLWPRQWQGYQNRVPCKWTQLRLESVNRRLIPENPGVYTLIIMSGVAGHPHGNYLMYVGKTKSLRKRFGQYLTTERGNSGRPKIRRLLKKYDRYVWFCYTEATIDKITILEDDLTEAFLPPCNDEFPATIRKVIGAF